MNQFSESAEKNRRKTNDELADELAPLISLSRKRLQELLPKKRDKQAFRELMEKVEDETEMDAKLAYLQDNVKTVGEVIFKVLKTFL